jgi:hypothetical protein
MDLFCVTKDNGSPIMSKLHIQLFDDRGRCSNKTKAKKKKKHTPMKIVQLF